MTQANNATMPPLFSAALSKRMLLGAVIGFIVSLVFVLPVIANPHPNWPELWMIRPMAVLPMAGICGAIFFHLMDMASYRGGIGRMVAYVLSFLVFVVGQWMGVVLGLVGTMWH